MLLSIQGFLDEHFEGSSPRLKLQVTCVDPATTWRPAVQALHSNGIGFKYQQGSHKDPEVIKLAQASRPSHVQNDAQCSERTTRLLAVTLQARDSSVVGSLHFMQGADIVICSHVAVDFIADKNGSPDHDYFAQVLASRSGWAAQAADAKAGNFLSRLFICQDRKRWQFWDAMPQLMQGFCSLAHTTSVEKNRRTDYIVGEPRGTFVSDILRCNPVSVPRQLIITRQTPLSVSQCQLVQDDMPKCKLCLLAGGFVFQGVMVPRAVVVRKVYCVASQARGPNSDVDKLTSQLSANKL
jgi:hypothetical protein